MGDRNVRPRLERLGDLYAKGWGDLYAKKNLNKASQVGPMWIPMSQNVAVEIHVPQDQNEIPTLMGSICPLLQTTEHRLQKAAYFSTIFLCYYPDLFPVVKGAFTEVGIAVRKVETRVERLNMGLEVGTAITRQEGLVYFAQSVFILFKQINVNSYAPFMKRQTLALRALVGMVPTDTITLIAVYETAIKLKTFLGSCFSFKKALVERLLKSGGEGETRADVVCPYICSMLAWNEMAAITFIYDTLLLTRSPVLKVLEIQHEVKNLDRAMREIASFNYPPFFKILNPPSKTYVMERNRFPILVEVAEELIADTNETVGQFGSARRGRATREGKIEIVQALVEVHRKYMNGRRLVAAETLGGSVNNR